MTRTELIMEKIARITGETFPHYSAISRVDTKDKIPFLRQYYKTKAREAKTPWGLAIGAGAGIGGVVGALAGAAIGQSRGAVIGTGIVGMGLGGLVGGVNKAADDVAIEDAKSIINSSNMNKRIKKALVDYVISDELRRELEEQERHEAVLEAIHQKE
jgi:hypothetical protein